MDDFIRDMKAIGLNPILIDENTDIDEKVRHVLNQPQTRPHTCHWPGCRRQVPPAMWGCREHWYRLPKSIRNAIWKAYRPGQEEDLNVSREYLDAAQAAEDWILNHAKDHGGRQPGK